MLGALFFRYFELAADEEGDGSVSEQVISRADLRCDGKLLMILVIPRPEAPFRAPLPSVKLFTIEKMISLIVR